MLIALFLMTIVISTVAYCAAQGISVQSWTNFIVYSISGLVMAIFAIPALLSALAGVVLINTGIFQYFSWQVIVILALLVICVIISWFSRRVALHLFGITMIIAPMLYWTALFGNTIGELFIIFMWIAGGWAFIYPITERMWWRNP
jgi:hypothetical protein